MKIIVAPNAFKGSLTAIEAANAMVDGISKISSKIITEKKPIADGGDGIHEVFANAFNGKTIKVTVHNPLHKKISSEICYLESINTAVIEMAYASGLILLSEEEKNPLNTSTYGTGELIVAALDFGVSEIIIGIGGSATNDGGIGMATALGAKFTNEKGNSIIPIGKNLKSIRHINLSEIDKRIHKTKITVICDVNNPLLGEFGATKVYARQKGADEKDIVFLESGMTNLADVIQKDIGIDVSQISGGGAAGGIGVGLYAFVDGKLKNGIEVVLDTIGINDSLNNADLVLTAEGMIDNQTAFGKAPAGVAQRAKAKGIPCLAIAGSISGDISNLHDIGINATYTLCPGPVSLEEAMDKSYEYLMNSTEQAVRGFLAGKNYIP